MVEELLGDGRRRGVDTPHGYAGARRPDLAMIDHERAFRGDPLTEFDFTGSESSAYGTLQGAQRHRACDWACERLRETAVLLGEYAY